MGRLSQAKGLRLGRSAAWAYSSPSLEGSMLFESLESYLGSICSNFYMKSNFHKCLLVIFDRVEVSFERNCLHVCVYLYDGYWLDQESGSFNDYHLARSLMLEELISRVVKRLTGCACKVDFYYLSNKDLTARLLVRYAETKLGQGFGVASVYASLKRVLMSSEGLIGYRFDFSGRFTRKQRASRLSYKGGSVPFSSLSSKIDYEEGSVILKYGKCGVKIWLNKAVA
jgi:hypothetical protein